MSNTGLTVMVILLLLTQVVILLEVVKVEQKLRHELDRLNYLVKRVIGKDMVVFNGNQVNWTLSGVMLGTVTFAVVMLLIW